MTAEEYANKYLENELKIIENSDRKIILPELTIYEKQSFISIQKTGIKI